MSAVVGNERPERGTSMKTMTCKQLGGPCDLEHHGKDANEIIHAQDRHLKDAVAAGSRGHEAALNEMKGRWKRPLSGLKWYRQVQRDFAALSDQASADN
jgi:predicted small metal-binding protein